MEIRKQAIEEVVTVATLDNLNLELWRKANRNYFNKVTEKDKKNAIESIFELPFYERHVRKYEMLWKKKRTDFNVLEREYVDRTYISN